MSKIIVQKFGGTSVGSVERIDAVAEIIKNASKSNEIIVVVSAMGGETNKLIKLSKHFSEEPDKRELTPELPDLKRLKSSDGVLTPPTE